MLASFRLQETQADTTDTTEIRADTTETGTATIENTPASPTVPMQDITRRTLDTAETSGGAPGTVKTRADAPEARIDTTETRGDALQTRIDSPADAREALANTTGTGTDTPETRIVPPSVQIQDPVRGTEFVDDALTLEMARNRSTDVRDDPFTLETAILNAEMTPEVTEKEDQLSGTRHNKSKVKGKGVTSTASGSAGRPRNPLLPNLLQTKHVYRWSYDDVVAFLRANLETWELEDAQYQIFKKEKISGKSLLLLTKEDFLIPPFELPLGSALAIVLIVRDLKKVKGIDECGAGMAPLEDEILALKRGIDSVSKKLNEMDGKKCIIPISKVSQNIYIDLITELGLRRKSITTSLEQSSRSVQAFQWTILNENAQFISYMNWLSFNLVLPQRLVFYNAKSQTNLLSTTHLSARYIFKGTMDVAVVPKENIDTLNVAGGLVIGFKLKKRPIEKDIIQTSMELLAASVHSVYSVVMILTDLGPNWHFVWLEKGAIVQCKFDFPGGVTFFESIANDIVENTKTPNAAYHARCKLEDATSHLDQPRVPDQQPMVRDVNLEQILKRPRIDPMDLVPEDDVADMRDVFDVMTPEEVRRIKVKRVLEYVMQSPALESIMNVSVS